MVKGRDGPAFFEPGTSIGRYRLDRELGRGGTSVVYLATDLHLGKQWAVKVIRCQGTGGGGDNAEETAEGTKRLRMEEVELMKRLDHPSLPRIVDVLEKDGMLLLVMDYVKGETLASLLKRTGPFGEETVREWMGRLAAVLDYLHKQDPPVIYRDMKPANVIRKPDGSLILLDLGIAREYKHDRDQDTRALGTKGYAPPEQYGNAQTDIRSDIYSLGMTAAELLTGCPPDRDPYLYKTHPFRKLHPEISKEFETILNRCLAFSPDDRYGSCRELMRDLQKKNRHRIRPVPRKKRLFRARKAGWRSGLIRSRKAWRRDEIYRIGKRLQGTGGGTERQNSRTGGKSTHAEARKRVRALILVALIVLEGLAAVLIRKTEQPDVRAESVRPELIREQEQEQDSLEEIRSMLDACDREGSLSEENGAILQQKLAGLPAEAYRDRTAWAELCFTIGRAYLYSYTGDHGSFRGRVLRAQPFFEEAAECLEEKTGVEGDGREEALSPEKVKNYERLCDFFSVYVYDRDGIAEPEAADCGAILEAVTFCLEEIKQEKVQETGDSVWLQLTLLQSMEELLAEYRQNFADAEIPRESVLQILQSVEDRTADLPVKREKLAELSEEILRECGECREQIERTYESMEKWKEAERVYGNTEEEIFGNVPEEALCGS